MKVIVTVLEENTGRSSSRQPEKSLWNVLKDV